MNRVDSLGWSFPVCAVGPLHPWVLRLHIRPRQKQSFGSPVASARVAGQPHALSYATVFLARDLSICSVGRILEAVPHRHQGRLQLRFGGVRVIRGLSTARGSAPLTPTLFGVSGRLFSPPAPSIHTPASPHRWTLGVAGLQPGLSSTLKSLIPSAPPDTGDGGRRWLGGMYGVRKKAQNITDLAKADGGCGVTAGTSSKSVGKLVSKDSNKRAKKDREKKIKE